MPTSTAIIRALRLAEAANPAGQLRSARSRDYLRDLAERLAPHLGLSAVQDFVDHAQPVLERT